MLNINYGSSLKMNSIFYAVKKKFRKMQDYYYTLAINSPMELSRYLAIQALKEANKKIC